MRYLMWLFLMPFFSLCADQVTSPAPESFSQELKEDISHVLPISYGTALAKMIGALLLLLALLMITVWMLRKVGKLRLGSRKSTDTIHILERKALSQKTVLYLVEIEHKKVLLAESQLEVRPLETWDTFVEDRS